MDCKTYWSCSFGHDSSIRISWLSVLFSPKSPAVIQQVSIFRPKSASALDDILTLSLSIELKVRPVRFVLKFSVSYNDISTSNIPTPLRDGTIARLNNVISLIKTKQVSIFTHSIYHRLWFIALLATIFNDQIFFLQFRGSIGLWLSTTIILSEYIILGVYYRNSQLLTPSPTFHLE